MSGGNNYSHELKHFSDLIVDSEITVETVAMFDYIQSRSCAIFAEGSLREGDCVLYKTLGKFLAKDPTKDCFRR